MPDMQVLFAASQRFVGSEREHLAEAFVDLDKGAIIIPLHADGRGVEVEYCFEIFCRVSHLFVDQLQLVYHPVEGIGQHPRFILFNDGNLDREIAVGNLPGGPGHLFQGPGDPAGKEYITDHQAKNQ